MSFDGDIPGNQNIERVLLKLQSHQTFNLCAQNDSYHEFCKQMASYIVYIHVYPVYIKGIPGQTFVHSLLKSFELEVASDHLILCLIIEILRND